MQIQIGDRLESRVRFGAEQVRAFAELSGDRNPIHIDPAAGRSSIFGQCVVHGALTTSLFSGLMAGMCPGGIYLESSVAFTAPVYVDEEITASVTVADVAGSRVALDLRVTGAAGEAVRGRALIKVPREAA